ncbi:MAG TPA: nuclear transport factor 2 family protein [Longimicrobiales bacterium]|nr:nuclear transport factor 2 family protein [Longimicrobiales bacterium]
MRVTVLTMLAAAALAAACQGAPSNQAQGSMQAKIDTAGVTAQAEKAVDGLFDAMNEHDADRIASHYLLDRSFAYMECTEFRIGGEGYGRLIHDWYPSHKDVTFQHVILHTIVLAPDVAVVSSQGRASDAGELFWTQVVKQDTDGTWRIAYEHESWAGCPKPAAPHPMTTDTSMSGE